MGTARRRNEYAAKNVAHQRLDLNLLTKLSSVEGGREQEVERIESVKKRRDEVAREKKERRKERKGKRK